MSERAERRSPRFLRCVHSVGASGIHFLLDLRVFVLLFKEQRLLEYVFLERLLREIVELHRETERLLGYGLQKKVFLL